MKSQATLLLSTVLLGAICTVRATEQQDSIFAPKRKPLYEWEDKNCIVWVSNINATFFGEPADNFDFLLMECTDSAKVFESVETLNRTVHSTEDPHAIMIALLNTTMSATMTDEQAADDVYLCNELSKGQEDYVPECEGLINYEDRTWYDMEL